jgi:hypothetical protein
MTLMVVSLSGGCTVMPRDVAEIELRGSIGLIILSWPVVLFFTLLGRRLNLVRSRVVLLQYGVYLLIQVIISISMGFFYPDIFAIVVILLVNIPYLLLIGGLLILVLPFRLLAWVPSFLLLPHYLMLGLQYVANSTRLENLSPAAIMVNFIWHAWFLAIPFGVAIFVGLFIRRRKERSRP